MSETIDKILYTSIFAYVLTMMCIITIKPPFVYDRGSNKFKNFGTNDNETLLPITVISITSCILIYFIVVVYNVVIRTLHSP
jgi:hypothetical protein